MKESAGLWFCELKSFTQCFASGQKGEVLNDDYLEYFLGLLFA